MASLREYLSKLETKQLEYLLSRESYGADEYPLSTVYLICAVLSVREPHRGSAKDIFLEFAGSYADNRSIAHSKQQGRLQECPLPSSLTHGHHPMK